MAEKNSLWKNIRKKAEQNRRTGNKPKEPTKEMLDQERKIKAQKANGGPIGDDGLYNMQRALELGYTPDETGHWPSVDSETGMWLKSKDHDTAWMEYLYGYALNPEVQKQYQHPVVNPEGYFGENQLQYNLKPDGGPTKSLVQPPVLLDDDIIYPTDNPYMPGVNKDILDSEYDSYMRWRENLIRTEGVTPEEFFQTYPSRQEWERKNFDPANLHNDVSLAQGGPTGGEDDPFKSTLNEGVVVSKPAQDFVSSWVRDPEFANRLNKNFPDHASKLSKKFYGYKEAKERAAESNLKSINKAIPGVISDIYNTQFLYNTNPEINSQLLNSYRASYNDPEYDKFFEKNMSKNPQGFTDEQGRIVITNAANDQYGPQSVSVHELMHKTGLYDDETFDRTFKGKFLTPSQDRLDKDFNRGEMYPFLMQMRFDNNFQPGEIISPERLKQIKESGYKNHLFKYYTDDEISKYLNTLASNQTQTPVQYAAQGGYMYDGGGPTKFYKKTQYDPKTGEILEYVGSQGNEYYRTPNTPEGVDFERRLPEIEVVENTGLYNPNIVGPTAPKFIPSETGFVQNPNWRGGDALEPVYPEAALLPASLPIKATTRLGQLGKFGLEAINPVGGLTSFKKGVGDIAKKVFPEYKNVYRIEPTSWTKDVSDDLSGRWFGELEEMPFYIKHLKDSNAGIRMIRKKMPTKEWEKISGKNMPLEARLMSQGQGSYKSLEDAIESGELTKGEVRRIRAKALVKSDIEKLTKSPTLFNPHEGIITEELANKLRYGKKGKILPTWNRVEYPQGDLGKTGAMDHILLSEDIYEKPILGIPRKYFPFEKGGSIDSYMYYTGGPMYYDVGGKVWKNIAAGLYGAGEGILDTITMGATDQLTDKGFDWLTKVGNKNIDLNDPDDVKFLKTQQQVKGYSNAAGAIGTAIFTGNVQGAIGQGTKGLNTAFQASDWASDDFKKWSQGISGVAGIAAGFAGGLNSDSFNAALKAGKGVAGFGQKAGKIGSFGNQTMGMIGGNKQSLFQQAQAREELLKSPEYLAMQAKGTQDYVNQGLSFAANGGPVNNNLLTLQNSMRENIKNHKKKYSKGGTFHKFGINKIPDSAGYHHENAYGGVPIGRDAMAEGGEFVIDGNYVISDEVDGMNTLRKDGKTMAEIFDKYLSPYKLRDLNSKNRDGLRRPNDSISLASIEQKKQQIIADHKESKAKEEVETQQKQMMVGGALQYAAAGGKLNKDLEKILSDDIQSYVEADNYYAYGGYLPRDKGFNMPNSYAKGGSIHIKESKKGTFTAAAKKRGKSVQEFAKDVLRNKGNYSAAMVKKANFARNAAGWKHAEGGNITPDNPGFNALPEYVQAKIMSNMAMGGPLYGNTDSEYTYAHGGPVVSNVNQGFGLYAQNRGGMMMAQGGMMQQQGGQDQMIQLIQAYAQATGVSPEEIIQQLQQMEPQAQQQAIQQMAQELQGGQQQSMQGQQMMPQQGMARGGNMYAVGGPPDGDPNSLDYIINASNFMYSPEFENYWLSREKLPDGSNDKNRQGKWNNNFYKYGVAQNNFQPNEEVSDFDRTLGSLKNSEKITYLGKNPNGETCYIIDGRKVCGPEGEIRNMINNRYKTYQPQIVADVYQNTTGDFAPYNYENLPGISSSTASQINQPDYSGDQNFTDRQNTVRGMVFNAMTRNQPTPVQPIEGIQPKNLQQLPTNNTTPELIPNNYPESSYRPATLTEEEQNMLDRMSNTAGFIPSDVMSGKLGTSTAPFPYEEGPVDNSIPKVGTSIEQNISFVPSGGSDIIEDLPGTVPTQTKVSDEAIGQSYLGTAVNPNLPKLTFTQSDATKYGLNPNDVNITDDTKVKQPNQGLTGLDYAMMGIGSLGALDRLRRGAKGPDPVNFERIGFEPYNYYPDIVLADAASREGEDKAAYDLKQNAPSSGSYMTNRRALGLGAGKNRADQRQRIKSAATQFDLTRKTGIDAQNAQIQMQESIARQQELDAARENVTEGLDRIGNRANMGYRDYKIDKNNQTIANNIGTTNWKVVDDGKGGSVVVFKGNDGSYKAIPYQQATTPNTSSTTASTGYMTPVNPNTTTPVATAAKSFKFDENITDKTKGDAFRAWVNKNYPRYAKNADLSLSGVYDNDYIKDAWDVYGEKYLGQS